MSQAPQSPRHTFGLGALFELTAGVALCLALVTQLEWVGLGMTLAGLFVIVAADRAIFKRHRTSAANNVGCGLMAILLFLLFLLLMFPTVSSPREASRGYQCSNNLHQLALALHDYCDLHGHFPPPYVADADGKPMHSWRVLILPHLGEDALFNAYNLKEPWNGPNNSKLASRIPQCLHCPSDDQMPPGMTSYFCVTGAGRGKQGQAALRPKDIGDMTGNTIALVESSSARVNWLDPRDLTMEDILAGKNTAERPCPCSRHGLIDRGMWRSSAEYFHAAMFDATVDRFAADLDAETLQALLTIDGGETVDLDAIPTSSDDFHVWPGFWVLLAAEFVFVGFAIVRRLRLARRLRARGAND